MTTIPETGNQEGEQVCREDCEYSFEQTSWVGVPCDRSIWGLKNWRYFHYSLMLPPIIILTSFSGSGSSSLEIWLFKLREKRPYLESHYFGSPMAVFTSLRKDWGVLICMSAFYKSGVNQTLRPVVSGIVLMHLQNSTRFWNVVFPATNLSWEPQCDSPPHVASHALTATWETGCTVGTKHVYCILYLTHKQYFGCFSI